MKTICKLVRKVVNRRMYRVFLKNYKEDECINYQQSLSGGYLDLPWEDGCNKYSYVICPHYIYKNILYVFG